MIKNVFHSKEACLRVLQLVERQGQSWWTPQCSEFLRRVERVPVVSAPPEEKILIVLEGMDGVGKSSVARALVSKLGVEAQLIATPNPEFSNIREVFRRQTEEISRAFYSASNYLAAWDAFYATDQRRFVVFDRWWCSTCAMALANTCTLATLPDKRNAVFHWPLDLPRPNLGILLFVDEHIRQERIRRRAPEDVEERRLSEQQEMREVTMEVYRRFGLFVDVYVLTYAVAVNKILQIMTEAALYHRATPFTEEELTELLMGLRLENLVPVESKKSGFLLPFAVTTLGAICAWQLYRRCLVHVSLDCLTIVYETRRRTILTTSMDKERKSMDDISQSSHVRPVMYVMGMLLYSSNSLMVIPPSSFFSIFTLPRAVLDDYGEGKAVDCTVEGIRVTDGYLSMVLTVWYCIPFKELERYLAAVGPTAPNEKIAVVTAIAAKARASELSVGLILNKTKRDEIFLGPFKDHLASKLMSEVCVKLINATVESASIAEKPKGA